MNVVQFTQSRARNIALNIQSDDSCERTGTWSWFHHDNGVTHLRPFIRCTAAIIHSFFTLHCCLGWMGWGAFINLVHMHLHAYILKVLVSTYGIIRFIYKGMMPTHHTIPSLAASLRYTGTFNVMMWMPFFSLGKFPIVNNCWMRKNQLGQTPPFVLWASSLP